MRLHPEEIQRAQEEYNDSAIREFARLASIQEAECYEITGEGIRNTLTRVEEIINFSKKCGYSTIGIAFCIGVREEARMFSEVLEARGFTVSSVCCKTGRVQKEDIGILPEEKIAPPQIRESMCNPIAQAEIFNREKVDLVVLLGLCVGHDSLFIKYCRAPITVLAAKDRVLAHNPLAALYASKSPYYRRISRKEELNITGKKIDISRKKVNEGEHE
ncbi:MAG: DUF1847 domain-containing protein [Spirochaetes bacterium]|nr:DUF1847 domain-containing protein [Spirochaetota bacterium]